MWRDNPHSDPLLFKSPTVNCCNLSLQLFCSYCICLRNILGTDQCLIFFDPGEVGGTYFWPGVKNFSYSKSTATNSIVLINQDNILSSLENWTWGFARHLWKIMEKEMAVHSSTLAWKIPWTEEPDSLQSVGSQRVGHDWATSLSWRISNRHPRRYAQIPDT